MVVCMYHLHTTFRGFSKGERGRTWNEILFLSPGVEEVEEHV